ncbi:MAG TPA: hypothetical protein VJ794_09565 [Gemmatimonadales bacterium]|nr:hypothetical protein [Gemmatimonadales bacterium]
MDLLVSLNVEDGTTILAVLHDLRLAAAYFPRLVVLDRGLIVGDGGPGDALDDDRVRSVFGVDPALVRSGA